MSAKVCQRFLYSLPTLARQGCNQMILTLVGMFYLCPLMLVKVLDLEKLKVWSCMADHLIRNNGF